MAAFRYYINRLLTLPLTQEGRNKEWATIINIAKNNGFPIGKITRLKTQLATGPQGENTPQDNPKKWSTFTYEVC